MGRFIGVRHRVKRTVEGESRPTEIFVSEDGQKEALLKLEDEDAELDFVLARLPVQYRQAEENEDLSTFIPRHIKQPKKKLAEGEKPKIMAPSVYGGLKQGDIVVTLLGGSGDRFNFALSRRAEEIGAKVLCISSGALNKNREGKKEDDAKNIVLLATSHPELFREITPRDRDFVLLRESLRARTDAMKARIACEQRLFQQVVGKIFCCESGKYPEGSTEQIFDEAKASDLILQALLKEERKRESDLSSALNRLDVYHKIFDPIEGCGPALASRLIAAIGNINRFESAAKLKAFCGVHVVDGRIARRRNGQAANWHPEARQALYLLGDQFNRRPNSEWGIRFREVKVKR